MVFVLEEDMMREPNDTTSPDNPAAFPCTGEGFESPRYTQHGMTLRDWFAGQALAGGLIQHYGYPLQCVGIAEGAYDIADAMLAERVKGPLL